MRSGWKDFMSRRFRLQALRESLTRQRDDERDLDDEIRFDLSEETRLLVDRGEAPEAARAAAQRNFGSVARVKEETREAWGWSAPERLLQDLRFAARTVRSSPGFSLAAALTLAVGMGLCSFLFNTLDALFLRPLPGARAPERLVASQGPVPFPYVERYRDRTDVATAVAAYIGPVPFNFALESAGAAGPERTFGHLVSLEYFSTLGAEPFLGRFFEAGLERPGAAPTVVVSERFWRTRLDADPRAVGRELWINGLRATLIGVTQKGFHGLFPLNPADIFVPVTTDAAVAPELGGNILDSPRSRTFRLVLRLAPGATLLTAEAALDVQTRQLDDAYGNRETERESTVRRVPLIAAGSVAAFPGELRSIVVVFMGAMTALILTFTCANLGGLLLARGSARRREIALRLALGASRVRLVRQLLAESVLVAVAGGAGGLAATYLFVELLTRTVSSSPLFRLAVQLTPSPRVAALTFVSAVLAGVGLGLLPALAATPTDLNAGLKAHPGASLTRYRRFGLRNLFVVYQITAATALVVIMGFMISGIQQGASRDPGFDTSGLTVFSVDPVRDGYTPEQAAALLAALPERLTGSHSAEAAALMDSGLFRQFVLADTTVSIPAAGSSAGGATERVAVQTIGPAFFATLGVSLQRGTEFSDRDFRVRRTADTVIPAVINHSAAELFDNTDPLGRIIRLEEKVLRVTGVVRYGLPPPFRARPAPMVFLPLTIQDLLRPRPQGVALMVRPREGDWFERMRSDLHAIDPGLTMFNARTIRAQIDDLYNVVRYTTAVYAIVGLFALVLASVGLAGVTAHAAIRRRKEIGIRMALGARSRQVLGLVMREGAVMASIGGAIGFGAAYALARALIAFSSQLGQAIVLGAAGPARLVAGPALLLAVIGIACYLPARRSATVDPLVSLREE
jgi:predicted permease